MAVLDTLRELAGKLRIKSGMMKMGERIAWGSDTELMDAAEAGILALLDENERLRELLAHVREEIDYWGDTAQENDLVAQIDAMLAHP